MKVCERPYCTKPVPKQEGRGPAFRFCSAYCSRKNWRRLHPDFGDGIGRNIQLLRRYGITINEYDALLLAQNGVCAICGKPPTRRRLDIDHNHKTGQVRGLLCEGCNRHIGFIENNPDFIHKAANYLEESR
jgi:endogenous inhibitor of DNA gyrase (YacG/DUF329 family)